LRGVQFHVSVEDWEGAVPLLGDLVKLEPRNASYRGILAKAMFKHPFLRHHAEKHFLEAVRLSPRDTDLHIWLGLYYRSSGKGLRAEKEFRTALALDPNMEQAKELLSKVESENRELKV
jgi:tetratricopeptide (TPR) repeat protein